MTTICKRAVLAGCLSLVFFLKLHTAALAADPTKEEPIGEVGTGTTVSVSTFAWTKVPTSSSLTRRRAGIKVSNPKTNNATMVGILSTSSTTPSEATTIRPIEIEAGENPFVPAGDNVYLYLMSLHTSAENVHAQEVRQ